ncbi:hypothetical protein DFH06DRAFT_708373 [Mycena polygramma]|nr:hypothetical protein DFH06DRAFT_708373 [Mycena polygramma]
MESSGAPTASGIVPNIDEPSHDFTHLLESNEAPLDREIPIIHDNLLNEEGRLAALDARIEELLATVAQLTERRDEVAERVRQHRAVLSPIRRLSPELLCEIFAATLSSGEWPRAPWHLGLICRSWRHAALSYSPLWGSVIIPSLHPEIPTQLYLDMVESQLERSANAPLRILWSGGRVHSRILDAVLAHCSRWSALHLESYYFHLPSSLDWLRPAAGHLSRLQTLRVLNSMGSWSFREIPDVFLTAPALREVVFTDGTLSAASPVSNNIPWAQITRYRGRDHIQRQLEILSAAPNLMDCTMGVLVSGFTHNGGSVILPRLRRLGVTNAVILDVLEAPALISFTLFHTSAPETILSFAQRSFCRLTKLILMNCSSTTPTELIVLLDALPPLTYLLLTFRSYHRLFQALAALFNAMTIDLPSTSICPNLASFLCGYHVMPDDVLDPLFSMVQSRLQRDSPCRLGYLRIFDTVGEYSVPHGVVARIATLRDGGLDAVFWGYRSVEGLIAEGVVF